MTPRRIVTDASALIAWAMNENGLGPTLHSFITAATLVVPGLWSLEVANAFLAKERRRQLTAESSERLLATLDALEIEPVSEAPRSLASIARFARPHQLTAYDAAYLDLAVNQRLPLLTMDHNLQDAARRMRVPLLLDRLAS